MGSPGSSLREGVYKHPRREGRRQAEEKLNCDAGLMTILAQMATKVACVGSTSQPSALYLCQPLGTSHPMKMVTLGRKAAL